jgi:hypothetical protein
MPIIKRTSTVQCDGGGCQAQVVLDHDLDSIGCSGDYDFNHALMLAGWTDVCRPSVGRVLLCPACQAKLADREARTAASKKLQRKIRG